ncbi:hypothetical protein IKF89_01635 [Candidatus Saccharibacteria bacterium]|nr:hypothetical protein [Candidatus Saccharibacteria bacterium]
MSTLTTQAEKMARELVYEEHCENGIGSLVIRGLSFPENPVFSPLDKIWSSVRKRNGETYAVYTTAVFTINEEAIVGEFYPNCAVLVDDSKANQYISRFEDTFSHQMLLFIDALESFLMDFQIGYVAYCKYLQKAGENVSTEECSTLLDAFLRQYKFKTDEDDAEKQRREVRSKELLKSKFEKLTDFFGF